MIADAAEPLPDFNDSAFGRLFEPLRRPARGAARRGESRHSRVLSRRAAITRHLIENRGFTIVAVEADWPDAAAVDRHVRPGATRAGTEPPFQRFPTWMWRNTEVAAFIDWLHGYNYTVTRPDRRVGFHGLDIYNMSGSIAAVLAYLDKDRSASGADRPRALRLPDALAERTVDLMAGPS